MWNRAGTVVVLLIAACTAAPEPEPPASASDATPSAAPAPPGSAAPPSPPAAPGPSGRDVAAPSLAAQDSGWSTSPRSGGEPPTGAPAQSAARAAAHPGFDRAVFEFAGALPPHSVRYVDPPLAQCGSGEPLTLEGDAILVVSFFPAQAHDDQGRPTVTRRRQRPDLPALRELRLVCDFEGEVTWAMGVAARVPFRILTLREPPRLVVDVRSGGG